MRLSHKLSLVALAVLLANCGVSSDEGVEKNENAATAGTGDAAIDSRDGLKSLRREVKEPRVARADIVGTAIAYLSEAATESAGVKSPEFTVLSVTDKDPADGLAHVRLQQTMKGIPVWGADAVVHLDDENVLGATGSLATESLASLTVTLTDAAALAKAKTERYGSLEVLTERETVTQVVHIADDGTPHLALHTQFFNEAQDSIEPALWNHIFDANTGALLARWNDVHTADSQASGPGGNPKWVHSWNGELDATMNASGQAVLTTSRLKTLNMNQTSSTASEVTGTLQLIGDAPINDAHGFAEITLNFLRDWMGRNSIDDNGFAIKSRVHYNRNYENAFWDGTQMTYGDGASTFYPLSGALDVVSHEIHHGFTSKHSNLRYSSQSGGLNEGFSDIAGKAAEFYYRSNPTWDLGADVFKAPGKALRYMCDPKKDGRSIDNASAFTSGMDPHYSSGVPNKAFCLASKRISSGAATGTATRDGVKRAAAPFFLANAQYWTSGTTYVQGCQGVMDAARAMSYTAAELAALKQSWADVGVACN